MEREGPENVLETHTHKRRRRRRTITIKRVVLCRPSKDFPSSYGTQPPSPFYGYPFPTAIYYRVLPDMKYKYSVTNTLQLFATESPLPLCTCTVKNLGAI